MARQPRRPSAITDSRKVSPKLCTQPSHEIWLALSAGLQLSAADNSDHQVIMTTCMSNRPPDFEYRAHSAADRFYSADALPGVMTMDPGYWSVDNAYPCADQGIDAYISTDRLPHGQASSRGEGDCSGMAMQKRAWPLIS